MKKYILLLLLSACGEVAHKKRNLSVVVDNGSGWGWACTMIDCDSLQMINTKEAYIFIDGTKMFIKAENNIRPQTNHYLK